MDLNGPLPTIAELRAHEEKRKIRIRFILRLFFSAAAVYLLFGVFFGLALVDGSSMIPGIPQGSVVLFLRLDRTPQRGDVVVFYTSSSKKYLIKRVVAKSGDTVALGQDGTFQVNGKPENGGVAIGKATDEKSLVSYPLKVPVESVFVLGDNRSNSLDSRQLGVINLRRITGTALLVFRRP